MAGRITAAEYIKENPNATLEDFKKAAGRAVTAIEEGLFKARENYLKNADSGVTNKEGGKSLADNPVVQAVTSAIDKEKIKEATRKGKAKIIELEEKAKDFYNELEGKDKKEQENIYWEQFKPESTPLENVFNQIEKKDKPEEKAETKPEEKAETKPEETPKESEKPKNYRNAYLESWAATHPTWGMILRDKKLTWGQKVALIGSALANIGANVTLGMKSGFEHSGFQPVEWDFKKAIDKYSNQDIENVLKAQQDQRAKKAIADFWSEYEAKHGKEATEELIALVDLYGDNPDLLSSRLRAMGIYKSADEVKDLYANLDKTTLSESAKQKKLETEAQKQALKAKEILNAIENNKLEVDNATKAKLIEATNALNDFNNKKYTSDKATYNFEKGFGIVKDAINVVEGVAGALSGKVVGTVKDGIIKAPGIPQKIVRADGTEIQLDPNDSIYATKNDITTEKDDGSDIVHMTQDDEVLTLQKRLGYSGGVIRKDFDYYLNILGA